MGDIKKLLRTKPNLEKYLAIKKNADTLAIIGVDVSEIKDLEDLIDVVMVTKALTGDAGAKRYLDERVADTIDKK